MFHQKIMFVGDLQNDIHGHGKISNSITKNGTDTNKERSMPEVLCATTFEPEVVRDFFVLSG